MKAKAIFNADGTVSICVRGNMKWTFTTVSAAVNFCKERKISAIFQ